MAKPDMPVSHIYFPDSGVGSVVARVDERQIEIGLFGREGMSAAHVGLGGDRSPYETFMQIAGHGWRAPVEMVRQIIAGSPESAALFQRYANAFNVQVAETAISNGLFSLEQRLARWLLMCHDRTDGDEIGITHEFLAIMLGVHRPAVTLGIQSIEGAGVIRAARGRIVIRDRARLLLIAGEAYGTSAAEYDRLLGSRKAEGRSATSEISAGD